MPYRRPLFDVVLARLTEPRTRIQGAGGPRRTGKTTLVRQALAEVDLPAHRASAGAITR